MQTGLKKAPEYEAILGCKTYHILDDLKTVIKNLTELIIRKALHINYGITQKRYGETNEPPVDTSNFMDDY